MGQEIKAHLGDEIYTFTIIGVYQYEQDAITASMMSMMGMSSDRDITTDLYIPITTEWKLSGAVEGYSYITVLTREGADARNLAGEFEDYFNRFYTRNRDFQITAISLDSIIDQSMTMMSTIQIAIVVIAAISLLVGGIGVMNIMLVSVTERTSEIGLKKALGAKRRRILWQFLTEAAVLTCMGGLLGVLTGVGLAELISRFNSIPVAISIPAIVISVVFSTLIGVIFGLLPAVKAANLNPIEALRRD